MITSTRFIDSDHPSIIEFARDVTAGATTVRERASRLFLAVREKSRYDPYTITDRPEDYVASNVLHMDRAYCIPKAVLLAAAARAVGIPARVGFADVMNHLTSEKLRQTLKGHDLYIWHGFTALQIDGTVFKVTPAFNQALCDRFGVPALEFDGEHDALLQPFDGQGRQYMEYKADRGLYDELPLEQILADFKSMYGIGEAQPAHDPAFH